MTEQPSSPPPPSFEKIAERHLKVTGQWSQMTAADREELVTMRADEAREWIAETLPDRTPEPKMDETPEQTTHRIETARFLVQSEAIRMFLLPEPPTGPTDPNEVERMEDDRRLGLREPTDR